MNNEIKHFTKVNDNLGLIVDDLKMRYEGLINERDKLSNKKKELAA